MGVHMAAEEALKQAQMIAPAPEQLALVSERRQLPKDEKQLHSLLMIEGDLMAGELDVPIEWLETLAKQEQAKYIEPGLWIAAEHEEKYAEALEAGDREARLQIVLRTLRYRGAGTPEEIADRYFWPEDMARELLVELCRQGSAVESSGLYYHSELYDRARRETIKSRRAQIKTLPAERFAALLTSRIRISAPAGEQLEKTMNLLCDQPYPPAVWESALLPSRVGGYRPELLDTLLAQGNLRWHFNDSSELSFHRYEDIDWDADLSENLQALEGNEYIIYEALLKRGASFMQGLSNLLGGASPHETLLKLAEKGLVCADSFMPVRQWLDREKTEKSTLKQRVNARVKALTTGRWELSRPLIPLNMEQQLERIFDRSIILCRETAQGLPWGSALETLRVWEFLDGVQPAELGFLQDVPPGLVRRSEVVDSSRCQEFPLPADDE
jgi:ATP-dependent Lhr-like helicase